jgi:serine/threonine-protein kinase RsbW
MPRRRLNLPGDDVSEEVGGFVAELARTADLPHRRAYWLRLAVDEIVTNIADHGYRGSPGTVELIGDLDSDQIQIQILDDAPAFDPRSYDPRPRLEQPLAERQCGGHGLMLALGQVDKFDYRHADGKNQNVLIMNRAGPGSEIEPDASTGGNDGRHTGTDYR